MTGCNAGAALLIQRSVDAFFRMDSAGRLVESNEAFPKPAPRLFVARTSAGVTSYARRDVPAALVPELTTAAAKLPPLPKPTGVAEIYDELAALLGTLAPVTDREVGIEFRERREAEELFAPFAAEGGVLDPDPPVLRDPPRRRGGVVLLQRAADRSRGQGGRGHRQ